MGRPPIGKQAMTTAQRKARSRVNTLGQLDGQLAVAEKAAAAWTRCMVNGRPGATDKDIQDAFADLAMHIAAARLAIPRS